MYQYQVKQYGGPDSLMLVQKEKPAIRPHEVLIQVKATSATTADYRVRSGDFPKGFNFIGRLIYGFKKPRISVLGTEISGVITDVGSNVNHLKIGNEVLVQLGAQMGGYQEFIAVDPQKSAIVLKPKTLTHSQAATMTFGNTTAYSYLIEKAKIKKDQKIIIFGASGSVGSAAVQIAKAQGAYVIAISRTENTDFLKELGADEVIDYRKNDLKSMLPADLVMECGGIYSAKQINHLVKVGGKLLLVSGNLYDLLFGMITKNKIISGPVMENQSRLEKIIELFQINKLVPVIDREYSFSQLIEAHKYLDLRHRHGNIAIRFE